MSQSQNPAETSTDHEQPTPTDHKLGMSRRDLLRRSAVGGATLAGVSTGVVRLDHGPVGNSQAIAPAVAAAGLATTAGVSLGWSLRDSDVFGSDAPPEGLTEGALRNQTYDTARARQSNNQSTFTDNQNILDGIDHASYGDGKIAAIDALNDQLSQDEVLDAAHTAVEDYLTTVQKNLLRSWNETVEELRSIKSTVDSHEDVTWNSIHDKTYDDGGNNYDPTGIDLTYSKEFTLFDGSTMQVEQMAFYDEDDYGPSLWSPDDYEEDLWSNEVTFSPHIIINYPDPDADHDGVTYLDFHDWDPIYSKIRDIESEIKDELVTWVDGVYDDIQAGELDTGELLTPREQSELTSEDEDFPQAIADLQALNVAVDLEREAEIYLPEIDATVYGNVSYTGDETLSTGTIQPDEKDGSIYLTYDVSQGQGDWSAYDDGGIDGGILTFTQEPFDETLYVVDTAAGETVEVTADDFEEEDDEDEWTVDLSDDLDDAITDIEQIQFFSEVSETQYETIQLQDEFEIVTFTDSDGEEYDESSFERSEPHTDDNYITEEEWQDQQERHEELIEKYEDAQDSGISIPGVEDVLSGEANGLIGIAVVGFVLVSAILSALNPLS